MSEDENAIIDECESRAPGFSVGFESIRKMVGAIQLPTGMEIRVEPFALSDSFRKCGVRIIAKFSDVRSMDWIEIHEVFHPELVVRWDKIGVMRKIILRMCGRAVESLIEILSK